MTAQDWLNAWLVEPSLRPPQDDGQPEPTEYGYRIPQPGTVEFYATFPGADGLPVQVSAVRNASDFGLQTTADGNLEPIGTPTA